MGKGYRSLLVILLSALKSMQNLIEPSGFLTNKTGDPNGLLLGTIKPASNNSQIWYYIIYYSAGLTLYICLEGTL